MSAKTTKHVPFTSIVAAADTLFSHANRRRVVAKVREGSFIVCSRAKARRLGQSIVAKNY